MEGLEDKLHVHLGDLIELTSPKFEVAGYVKDYTPKIIELSIENPQSELYGNGYGVGFRRSLWGLQIRKYNLGKFEAYKVLKLATTKTKE